MVGFASVLPQYCSCHGTYLTCHLSDGRIFIAIITTVRGLVSVPVALALVLALVCGQVRPRGEHYCGPIHWPAVTLSYESLQRMPPHLVRPSGDMRFVCS